MFVCDLFLFLLLRTSLSASVSTPGQPCACRASSGARETNMPLLCICLHLRSLLSPGGGSSCGRLWCCSSHVMCCGVVLVVSCRVLFLLCVCGCDLFLFLYTCFAPPCPRLFRHPAIPVRAVHRQVQEKRTCPCFATS